MKGRLELGGANVRALFGREIFGVVNEQLYIVLYSLYMRGSPRRRNQNYISEPLSRRHMVWAVGAQLRWRGLVRVAHRKYEKARGELEAERETSFLQSKSFAGGAPAAGDLAS
jgi:hypothetical protein